MKIAVIGTGTVGQALARGWVAQGHSIIFGTRTPDSDDVARLCADLDRQATAAIAPEAAAEGDLVVLATPWSAARQVAESLGDIEGKVLIDATNPIGPNFQLAVGTTTSGAEQIAAALTNGRVVKAFNTTGAENMENPILDSTAATMFICGDDEAAKATVAGLAEALGFEVADTGPLATARYLEPMAMVWIHLAMVQGQGRDIAFKLISR